MLITTQLFTTRGGQNDPIKLDFVGHLPTLTLHPIPLYQYSYATELSPSVSQNLSTESDFLLTIYPLQEGGGLLKAKLDAEAASYTA